jgi:hypothetical protein
MFIGPPGRVGMSCMLCGRDLWDVPKYVFAGHVCICAECINIAHEQLLASADSADRAVLFPPRVFGDAPDDEAVDSITKTFSALFGADAPLTQDRSVYLEDAEDLTPVFQEAGARNPGMTATTRVDRIRFLDKDTADVRFQLLVAGGQGPIFDGRVVRRGRSWIATRETALRVLALGGAHPRRT